MSEQATQEAGTTKGTEAPAKEEKKEKKPRLTFKEKFEQTTTEEERVQLAEKVVELRLDPEVPRAPAWKQIREHADVSLSSDEFHKIIRVSDYYRDAVLERLETQIENGWVYNGSLHTLCGIDVPEDIVERMEANKDAEKAAAKAEKEAKKESKKKADGDGEEKSDE